MKSNLKSPRVSVVLPTRDSGGFLKRSVESILGQTYDNFELILVDDSTSETDKKLILKISETDSRIQYCSNIRRKDAPRTLGHLLNEAIKLSSSDFIVRQDSDDYSFPTRIEEQIEFLLEHNLDLVGSQGVNIDESGKYLSSTSLPSKSSRILEYLDFENPLLHTSTVFRKSVYEMVGRYDEELTTAQDYDLWFRFSKRQAKIGMVNSNLVAVTRWSGSITSRTHTSERERNLHMIKERNSQGTHPNSIPKIIRTRQVVGELRSLRVISPRKLFYLLSSFNQVALIISKEILGLVKYIRFREEIHSPLHSDMIQR